MKRRYVVELGAIWQVGNGQSINFWSNWWFGDKPLGVELEIDIPEAHANAKVSDFILLNLTWNVDKF